MQLNKIKKITIGITGASGVIYTKKLIEELLKKEIEIHLVISNSAIEVLNYELDWKLSNIDFEHNIEFVKNQFNKSNLLNIYNNQNWFVPIVSGSNCSDIMIICPASMGVVSAIANGASNNVLERAADVCIKEKRKLIVVPRETPLSTIHLKNMLFLSQIGVNIIPAMPGFYNKPQTINDLASFLISRILNHIGLENNLSKKWQN